MPESETNLLSKYFVYMAFYLVISFVLHCFAVLNNSQSRSFQTSIQSGLYTQWVNDFSQHVNTFVYTTELGQSNQHTRTVYSREMLISLNKANRTRTVQSTHTDCLFQRNAD